MVVKIDEESLHLDDIDYSDLEAEFSMPEGLNRLPDLSQGIVVLGLPIVDAAKKDKLITHVLKNVAKEQELLEYLSNSEEKGLEEQPVIMPFDEKTGKNSLGYDLILI